MVFAGIEQVVQINRLVGAVEVSDADMQDAGMERLASVLRPGNCRGQIREIGKIQALAHGRWT